MTDWSKCPERGAAWLIRLMLWLVRHMRWFASGLVLPGISVWFFLRSADARAASRDYLTRSLGHPVGALHVLRHIHVFARSILDRVLLVMDCPSPPVVEVTGLEHVEAVATSGRGGVLLGAHLGSFAVLHGLAERCPVPVKLLLHRANAGFFTEMMDRLNPALAQKMIEIGDIQSMLRVREAVGAGALVGMLADRAPAGARCIMAPFLGRPAAFPTGPFILAASLGVPVLVFRGVRTGPGRYRVEFAHFADRLVLHRANRQADLAAAAARYASWLEEGCRAYPYNWFNFYPFWQARADGDALADAEPRRGAARRRADAIRGPAQHAVASG